MFGIGGHKRAGAGDNPVSVAKISGLCMVVAALIGVVPTSISLLSHDEIDKPPLTNAVTTPTTTSLSTGGPDTGLTFSPLTNGKLTVSGSAQKDVVGMYVVIAQSRWVGTTPAAGMFANQRWQAQVTTDQSWPN